MIKSLCTMSRSNISRRIQESIWNIFWRTSCFHPSRWRLGTRSKYGTRLSHVSSSNSKVWVWSLHWFELRSQFSRCYSSWRWFADFFYLVPIGSRSSFSSGRSAKVARSLRPVQRPIKCTFVAVRPTWVHINDILRALSISTFKSCT